MPRQQKKISPAMKEFPRKSREYNLWCGLERNGLLLNSFFSKNTLQEKTRLITLNNLCINTED